MNSTWKMAAVDRLILQMSLHFPALATLAFAPFSITSRGINMPSYTEYVCVYVCVCVMSFRHTALYMFKEARSENSLRCTMAIYSCTNLGQSSITQTSAQIKASRTVFEQAKSKVARQKPGK